MITDYELHFYNEKRTYMAFTMIFSYLIARSLKLQTSLLCFARVCQIQFLLVRVRYINLTKRARMLLHEMASLSLARIHNTVWSFYDLHVTVNFHGIFYNFSNSSEVNQVDEN